MILLDTHVVLWLALEPSRISAAAKAEIEQTRSTGSVMMISTTRNDVEKYPVWSAVADNDVATTVTRK